MINFTYYPECWVSNYLENHHVKFFYIGELMPVHLPSYIKKYPYASRGRFYIFPNGKMITHHIEDISNGIEEKKFYFNVISESSFFETTFKKNISFEMFKIKMFRLLTSFFLRRSWYSKRKRLVVCNV